MTRRIPRRNPKKKNQTWSSNAIKPRATWASRVKFQVSGLLEYEVQETWDTGPESTLERADIDNQILKRMTKFMTDSRLFKTPGHKPKNTDIYFGSCTARNIIARDWMKPYELTSAQWLIAALALRGAECAAGKIIFGLSSTERMMRPVTPQKGPRNPSTSKS
jgi:hypothetical protein